MLTVLSDFVPFDDFVQYHLNFMGKKFLKWFLEIWIGMWKLIQWNIQHICVYKLNLFVILPH